MMVMIKKYSQVGVTGTTEWRERSPIVKVDEDVGEGWKRAMKWEISSVNSHD